MFSRSSKRWFNYIASVRSRNCLLFASTSWVHRVVSGGSVLLICLVFCVVLFCVFTFLVLCCDGRYDCRIKIIFSSSLTPVVCRKAHVLVTLFVFACVEWCPTHIVLCCVFCFVSRSAVCTQCCQFLWIVHSWLPLRFSLAFI